VGQIGFNAVKNQGFAENEALIESMLPDLVIENIISAKLHLSKQARNERRKI